MQQPLLLSLRTNNIKPSQAKAPGKLILSGEHAVVYQQPALAMAVNRFMTINITASEHINIHFMHMPFHCDLSELAAICDSVKSRYQQYQQGERDISQVLHHPAELLLLILQDYPLQQGININIDSELPIGCGMGASAALIVATITALDDYCQQTQSKQAIYDKALQVEHYQHGHSSGLDIAMSLYGGAQWIADKNHQPLDIHAQGLYIMNSGVPASSTGECVNHVKRFANDTSLWQQFAAVTQAMKTALVNNKQKALYESIKTNHRLLCHIGVVPDVIQRLIASLEAARFAAKISGAGSIAGDAAGTILIASDDYEKLQTMCAPLQLSCQPLLGEADGARTT